MPYSSSLDAPPSADGWSVRFSFPAEGEGAAMRKSILRGGSKGLHAVLDSAAPEDVERIRRFQPLRNSRAPTAANDGGNSSKGTATNAQVYAPPGTKCEIHNLYRSKTDGCGRSTWTKEYPDDLEDPPENSESAQYALLVRNEKAYDGRKKLQIHSIVVQSPLIKKVLGTVLADYPGVTTSLERLKFTPPFKPLLHRWERFARARETEVDAETREHLDLLWGILEEELRDTIREKNDHLAHGVIAFSNIWTIFEPGAIVYCRQGDHDRAFRLLNGGFAATRSGRIFNLESQFVDLDGAQFGFDTTFLSIAEFTGTMAITSLSAFPLSNHPEQTAVAESLVARGRLFEAYRGCHYKAYEGIAMEEGSWGEVKFSVNGRIIIDAHAWNQFRPNAAVHLREFGAPKTAKLGGTGRGDCSDSDESSSSCPDSSSKDAGDASMAAGRPEASGLSEDQLLICASTLRGYSLNDKKWLVFFLASVKEIVWNDQAFDSLVAPPEQKELILAFAESQAKCKDLFDDVIQGKGRGIIILLSGPPGVGKTLTAEAVAETMKVPLYALSAGDLCAEPSILEPMLSKILQMTTKWNAVLLLDEADVFLEARSKHDLERNKLVSIFLRLLEYYEGTMFLTTNRVDNIDRAFESRIHLSLQYEELDESSRRIIWGTFLKRARAEFSEAHMEQLAKASLNGRQIKNILKTAQLLAARQETGLEYRHVEVVMRLRKANQRIRKVGG